MNRIAVLVVRDSSPIQFAGLDLADRAARVARRAGAETVQMVDDDQPFASAPPAELLLVLPERVVVEPGLLADLMRRSLVGLEDAAVVVDAEGKSTDILLLSPEAVKRIRFAPRVRSGLRQLAVEAVVAVVNPGSRFCARLRDARDVARVEADYLHATNGGDGEGLFTKNIRWFSIPLTTRLVRLGVTANAVTIAGFALAVAAGAAFAVGHYWTGIVGALLYFASMVLDCSDGEVARATVSDSKFGAWLETVTDYLSYFVVLGGIVWGDVRAEGFCKHALSAIVAAAATVSIVSAGRLPAGAGRVRQSWRVRRRPCGGAARREFDAAFCGLGPSVDQAFVRRAPHSVSGTHWRNARADRNLGHWIGRRVVHRRRRANAHHSDREDLAA